MTLFSTIRTAAKNRAAYHRTRRELRNMPLDVARDLDLYPLDAGRTARRAVYG